jgi:hypothetical protein
VRHARQPTAHAEIVRVGLVADEDRLAEEILLVVPVSDRRDPNAAVGLAVRVRGDAVVAVVADEVELPREIPASRRKGIQGRSSREPSSAAIWSPPSWRRARRRTSRSPRRCSSSAFYADADPAKFERAALRWHARYVTERWPSLLRAQIALAALGELRAGSEAARRVLAAWLSSDSLSVVGSISEKPGVPTEMVCVECRRRPDPDENADDDWRVYSDSLGGMYIYCPECAGREFGCR